MNETRGHKINCYVDAALWEKISQKDFTSQSQAVNEAFEALVLKDEQHKELQAIIEECEEKVKNCEKAVKGKEKVIEITRSERDVLQSTVFEKNQMIEELLKRIDGLDEQVKRANEREDRMSADHGEYVEQMKAYMAQMQGVLQSKVFEQRKPLLKRLKESLRL